MALLLEYSQNQELEEWGLHYQEANCSALPALHHSYGCQFSSKEIGERSFVALLRLGFSLLSILGTLSIIISVICRKQILNPKIHPIFMLSLADLFLAVMWVVGAGVWLSGGLYGEHHNRVNCFIILLITVIVECVAINLTCVYALLAYSSIKKKDFTNVYSLFEKDLDKHTWTARRTVFSYMVAWLLPVVLVMLPFFVEAKLYNVLEEAASCSCWCLPYFGNVLPVSNVTNNGTALYMHHLSLLVASYGVVVLANYLLGFILLVFIYWKILRLMNKMKASFTQNKGAVSMASNVFARGHSRAKLRVLYFLTIFVVTGFFNFLLSCGFVAFEIKQIRTKLSMIEYNLHMPSAMLPMYIIQSITVPLQGFLNAIVYGWTREDFILVMRPEHDINQTQQDNLFKGHSQDSSTNSGSLLRYQHRATDGYQDIDQQAHLGEPDMLLSVESEPEH